MAREEGLPRAPALCEVYAPILAGAHIVGTDWLADAAAVLARLAGGDRG